MSGDRTPMAGRLQPRELAFFVALMFGAYAGYAAARARLADDSWIVLRYVRNILDGHGWVFNIGEHVNGSTSTLNTLALAGFGWLTGDLVAAQAIVFVGSVGGTAVCWYLLFRKFGLLPAGVAATMLLASPFQFFTIGLESTLVLFLGSLTVLLFVRERLVFAGAAFGLLFLARGDGILLGVPLGIVLLMRRDREAMIRAAWFFGISLLVVSPWLLFSTLTFGSPMPQTFAAKLAQTAGGSWGDNTFFRSAPIYLGSLDSRALGLGPWPFGLVCIAGSVWAVLRRRDVLAVVLIVGWSALQFGAYSMLGLPRYHWYYAQTLFAVTLAAVAVVVCLWTTGIPETEREPRTQTLRQGISTSRGLCVAVRDNGRVRGVAEDRPSVVREDGAVDRREHAGRCDGCSDGHRRPGVPDR